MLINANSPDVQDLACLAAWSDDLVYAGKMTRTRANKVYWYGCRMLGKSRHTGRKRLSDIIEYLDLIEHAD